MPNHIINTIQHRDWEEGATDFQKILEKVKGDDRKFDFNTLIPYPTEFQVADDERSEAEKRGVNFTELPKDGFNNGGYEWRIENWGTKWNAYKIRTDKYSKIVFQTAWNHPFPIIKAFSKMFPKDIFEVGYADEDRGCNMGIYVIQNGEVECRFPEFKNYSDEAIMLANVLWMVEDF